VLFALCLSATFLFCIALGSAAKKPIPGWDGQAEHLRTHFQMPGVATVADRDQFRYLAFDASI
jgi:hypothetical protein